MNRSTEKIPLAFFVFGKIKGEVQYTKYLIKYDGKMKKYNFSLRLVIESL
jgi:hypothetical protein